VTIQANRPGDGPSVREGYLPIPGAQLYFREIGDGLPLVILHGGPDFNHNYLLPEMDRLSSDFRLIYYDQRGRGKSSAGVVAEDVAIDSEVDDLDRLTEHFGLSAITLLGHSWGGLLAMEFVTRHPDRVTHLILMNTAPASHADPPPFDDPNTSRISLADCGCTSHRRTS
jgi:proline iminopeptidase